MTKRFTNFPKLQTDSHNRIRLCIVNNIRAADLNKLPGVIFEEAMKFSEQVDEVHVVLFSKRLAKIRIDKKVSVYAVPFIFRDNFLFFALSVIIGYFMLIPLVTLLTMKCKINVARADDVLLTGLPTSIACKITGTPIVIYVAGSLEDTLRHKLVSIKARDTFVTVALKISRVIETFVMKCSDHVFALTSSLIRRATVFGAKSVSWAPSFLNLSRFKPATYRRKDDEKTRVLYVGRLEPEKGADLLLEAASRLKNEKIEFVVVGDGSLRERMLETVEKLDLENVEMIGSKAHIEMPSVYNDADIFVLPSFTEGMPVAMLEAMACQKPVIVTPVGVIPELLKNEVHALIIPSGDVSGLINAIQRLTRDRDLRERIAANGRKLVLEKFSNYIEIHLKAYARLLSSC